MSPGFNSIIRKMYLLLPLWLCSLRSPQSASKPDAKSRKYRANSRVFIVVEGIAGVVCLFVSTTVTVGVQLQWWILGSFGCFRTKPPFCF